MASRRDDSGAGLLPTVTGVASLLGFLLLASQVLFNLYAASAVQAAAFDAARLVASEGSDPAAAQPDAERHVRSVLGRFGEERVRSVRLAVEGESLRLTVVAKNPSLLPALLPDGLMSDTVVRSALVRLERVQPVAGP